MQDEDGGHLIDDLAMLAAGAAGGVEVAMGFGGGEPLVPQGDGELKLLAQDFGEGVHLGSLGAQISRHVERVADDDVGAVVFAHDAGERLQVLSAVGADQGEHRLGQSQQIGDGHADAAVAYVEAEDAGLIHMEILPSGAQCGVSVAEGAR